MSKSEISRRKFLGRSGTAALALPLAAAIPAAIETSSPKSVKAAMMEDDRQLIPNRTLPTRSIGSTTVTVSGLPTDGTSDCSGLIQSAINGLGTGGGTVIIPYQDTGNDSCVYMLDTTANVDGSAYYALKMNSNVRLECKPGVRLQAIPITQTSIVTNRAYMVYCLQVHDVEIVNCCFVGERYNHVLSPGSTDEWCHGLQILGVTGVTIRSTHISDCTGDGIDIGNFGSTIASDIVICDVTSTGNRRQALSINGGDSISLYDSEFSYTDGTAPMDGIDIEPGGAGASNITIENCVVRGNAGCGIQLNAHWGNITNVNVKNCLVSYNFWHGFISQMSNGKTIDGGSLYGNAFFQNGQNGIYLGDTTTNYTVGAKYEYGDYSNSFADNKVSANSITYPNPTSADTQGYVAGRDMGAGSGTLASGSGTVIRWNTYYTP